VAELAHRSLTPLDAQALNLPRNGQTVDLRNERFLIRVPQSRPAGGYGLLVFIPPWDEGRIPSGWGPVLDRYGMIFVSALKSGNSETTLGRREPLAILAAHNVAKRYPVDPARVFVGGFSGGSRVAMRTALAYPDVFRGALLESGSDPIGTRDVPFPSRQLYDLFRRNSRIVYVTGALDEANLDLDSSSYGSMRKWCVSNVSAREIPSLGHAVMSGVWLSIALTALLQPPKSTSSSDACWARLLQSVDAGLAQAASLKATNPAAAQDMSVKTDRQFGGLTLPQR
jgi:hypothetical protein